MDKIVYHGTDRSFQQFRSGMASSSGVASAGIFFTSSKTVAQGYGNRVIAARLNLEDWVEFDFNGRSRVFFDGSSRSPSELVNRIAEINQDLAKGYIDPDDDELLLDELEDAGWTVDSGLDYIDAVIMKDVNDSMELFGNEIATHYVVFDMSTIQTVKKE
jgi:hypothetical protein